VRSEVERWARDTRRIFEAPHAINDALKGLLAVGWLRVGTDRQRGFRVDGVLWVPLQNEAAQKIESSGRLVELVAGDRYTPRLARRADYPFSLAA
jgi:hypothetical protein